MATENVKGQMDLFGNLLGEEAVTEETTPSSKPSTAASKSTKTSTKTKGKVTPPAKAEEKEPETPILVHADWKVEYYSTVFEVGDLIDEVPTEGVEVEEIREMMERDYPGLSKSRAYWEIDEENKHIFMRSKGGTKGSL